MQYTDDCALLGHTPEDLQEMITVASKINQKLSLQINAAKTEILVWSSNSPLNFTFVIIEIHPNMVPRFKYQSSYLLNDCRLDDEVETRVSLASRAFDRLRERAS